MDRLGCLNKREIEFIAEAFDTFTTTYFNLIEKGHNDPFTEQDLIAQNRVRKAWLVDQLFSDPYAKKSCRLRSGHLRMWRRKFVFRFKKRLFVLQGYYWIQPGGSESRPTREDKVQR